MNESDSKHADLRNLINFIKDFKNKNTTSYEKGRTLKWEMKGFYKPVHIDENVTTMPRKIKENPNND